MKQKIEWYKEVLELEPGSKIFFPLARMLAQDGQEEEALTTLRRGIDRHPDHVEAHLLLVELLFQTGRTEELLREVDKVGALLGGYPGFWKAWGEKLFHGESTRDAGLAVLFIAAFLQRKTVSWADVIAQGLQGLLDDGAALVPRPASVAEAPDPEREEPLPAKAGKRPGREGDEPAVPAELSLGDTGYALGEESSASPDGVPDDAAEAGPETGGRKDAQEAGSHPGSASAGLDLDGFSEALPEEDLAAGGEPFAAAAENGDEDEPEEPFSLRTRSMAEVLAEQGDLAGALEIYQELRSAAATDEEKSGISMRMDELTRRLDTATPAARESDVKSAEAKSGPGKNRLTDMLEALAQRLEARSLQ